MVKTLKEEYYYKGIKITEGTFLATGEENMALPLKYTEVRANIVGLLSEVTLIQKFHNSFNKNIEAVYVFPLPHESAVNDLEIKIGQRIIKSEIKEREEARRTYEEARDNMRKAALLEEENPNIFTMSVANIEPGQEILVTLKYHEIIKYEDGEYEFVFPTTITPRYNEGSGEGKDTQTNPPVRIAGREINIFVNIDAGFEIGEITSPSHLIFEQKTSDTFREIQLAREGELPNKDFVLKYSSKGENLETSLSFYRKEYKPGTFMLHLTPKVDYGPDEMLKREMIFVLDRSGSMSWGDSENRIPMEQAKKALRACLRTLRAGDSFTIITFDDQLDFFSNKPLEFNDENLRKADVFIDSIYARGGTDIFTAMTRALKIPVNKENLRQLIFLTDGAVNNEEFIIEDIKKLLGKARIFTFGIGPSVNRYLLDKMAEMGKGTARYLLGDQNIEEEIQKFSNQTAFPILSDISLEWKEASVADIYPAPLPDLYFGQVLYALGRFHSDGKCTATLKGRTRNGEFVQELPVELPEKAEIHPVIETIWARKRIDMLLNKERERPKEKHEIREEIIGIALKYHLMSPYTSLVAVEKEEGKDGEREIKEILRVDIPSIVHEDVFANQAAFCAPPPPMAPCPVAYSSAPAPGRGRSTPRLVTRRASSAIVPKPSSLILKTALPMGGLNASGPQTLSEAAPVAPVMKSESFKRKADVSFEPQEELSLLDFDEGEAFESMADIVEPEKEGFDRARESKKDKAMNLPGTQAINTSSIVDLSFKWLARNQKAEGFWSDSDDVNLRVLSTALACLAFIGHGNTSKMGDYMAQISKAISYIESNLNQVKDISLGASAWMFFELYNISQKKKEKGNAEKALQMLKSSWSNQAGNVGKLFFALAGKSALKSGIAKEGDFPEIDKIISETKEQTKSISAISSPDDLFSIFINVIAEKEDALNLLSGFHISGGNDSGQIRTGLSPLDGTAIGTFIFSWKDSKLAGR